MTKDELKIKLIENGIKNLNEFGYDNVNSENIKSDLIYANMFQSMLKENLGHSVLIDDAINELLTEVKELLSKNDLG